MIRMNHLIAFLTYFSEWRIERAAGIDAHDEVLFSGRPGSVQINLVPGSPAFHRFVAFDGSFAGMERDGGKSARAGVRSVYFSGAACEAGPGWLTGGGRSS